MMSCDNVTARYLNNLIMDFLKIVNSSIIFIAQVISQKNIPHRLNCHKMKRKIYHTVWTVIKRKTKYTTPFELSSNEKKNIPHRSNCHKMKRKIYHTVRTVIKWKTRLSTSFRTVIKCKTKYTTAFELSSNKRKNILHS